MKPGAKATFNFIDLCYDLHQSELKYAQSKTKQTKVLD